MYSPDQKAEILHNLTKFFFHDKLKNDLLKNAHFPIIVFLGIC